MQTCSRDDNHVLCWNCSILPDKVIVHNHPYITCIDKFTDTTYILDVAVPDKQPTEIADRKIKMYQHLGSRSKNTRRQSAMYFFAIDVSATGGYIDCLTKLDLHLHTCTQLHTSLVLNVFALVLKCLNFCLCAHLPSALAVVT